MSKRYSTVFCNTCGRPIHNSDGKIFNKKGEWTCTDCLMLIDSKKVKKDTC